MLRKMDSISLSSYAHTRMFPKSLAFAMRMALVGLFATGFIDPVHAQTAPKAGFTLTGNLVHTGKRYINQTNTQSASSWTTFDFGARYSTKVAGKSTIIRANLLNAFDRNYWAGVASFGTLSLGTPRTVLVSATVDF